jgi:DUF971 family protein
MKPAEVIPTPTGIEQTPSGLTIRWNDGASFEVSSRALRLGCPCAGCVEEWSGRRIVEPAQIAADIAIGEVESVGNYAVCVKFSDGHSTGIYSWKTLRALCELKIN